MNDASLNPDSGTPVSAAADGAARAVAAGTGPASAATRTPGGRRHGHRPSIADVAKHAGVSLGTVSHVLNHPERVTAHTRARVEASIRALGYHPNRLASSLASGRSRTIGLALTDLNNSLFVDIARGAGHQADEADMQVLLADGDSQVGREVRNLQLFDQLGVAGSMITLSDEEHMAALVGERATDRPLVLLNFSVPASWFCSVAMDNELGGYLAARHLLTTGRRRLALIGGPDVLRPVHDRQAGFRRALAESGLNAVREIHPAAIDRADGWAAGRALADEVRVGRVDGVVACSDLLAAGVIQAFLADRLTVPQDVAVTGYDDNRATWDLPVTLTTVAQPGEQMGREGARLVIDEACAGQVHQHEAVVLPPHLVVRDSAPAPG